MRATSWKLNSIDAELIRLALEEDLGQPYTDLTTQLLFPDTTVVSTARIISKHPTPIILCGLPVITYLFEVLQIKYELQSHYNEGKKILPGQTLMTFTAPASQLLMLERTLLNFLQHLCAIATTTGRFVEKVKHTKAKILDTRKTLPGFRHLDKYAVQCGGGENHRMGLYDAIMVKDTHIDSLGGMEKALAALPATILQTCPVIIEVRSLHELNIVLKKGLDKISRILLDNMSLAQLTECVALCNGLIPTEASGNVTLENVAAVAECGVDYISIGSITHSAGNANLSMICEL